jgi:hypothetical protein
MAKPKPPNLIHHGPCKKAPDTPPLPPAQLGAAQPKPKPPSPIYKAPANRNPTPSPYTPAPIMDPRDSTGTHPYYGGGGWRWKKCGGHPRGAPHFFQPTGPPNII